ncbi:c-type cytochrome [Pseudalkalibacillus caeni]|uniref:Cytochrome c n=1 Tax=Exobacillus caeni TaxID=2574798 RepID=A0A5R9F118_9BACL|nr:cytochrome c [Pseudalkalibacillus caeni]TLS36120.1 cytochrome c [Pseudalkalibacillus caeni]
MKKLGALFTVFMLVVGLVACGGGNNSSSNNTNNPEEGVDEGGSATVDGAAAEKAFQQNCASCHGENLEGGTGPALENTDLSKDEILNQIQKGGGGMPANLVEGEKAENLAAWIAEK